MNTSKEKKTWKNLKKRKHSKGREILASMFRTATAMRDVGCMDRNTYRNIAQLCGQDPEPGVKSPGSSDE